MKALSLWQPWATLIAVGAKQIETRHWSVGYRGWLAIHAAKKSSPQLRELAHSWPFAEYLEPWVHEHGPLPLGAIVAVARLDGCLEADVALDTVSSSPHELEFGHYGPGRVGWVLRGVVALPRPVPCNGEQGLWVPPTEVVDELRVQYREVTAVSA